MGEHSFLEFPFGGGLDEKIDKAYLDPNTRQQSVQNGNFIKVNAVDKRMGIGALGSTAVGSIPGMQAGLKLGSWNRSSLNVIGMTKASASNINATAPALYAATEGTGSLLGISYLPDCYPLRQPVNVASGNTPPVVFDFPQQSGDLFRIAISLGPNPQTVFATVFDANTGNVVLEPTQLGGSGFTFPGANQPTILNGLYLPNADPTLQALVLIQDTNNGVWAFNYNATTNAFTTPGGGANFWEGASAVDVAPYVDDPLGGFLMAYTVVFFGTQQLVVQYFSPACIAGGTNNIVVSASGVGTVIAPMFVTGTYGFGNAVTVSYCVAQATAPHLRNLYTQWFAADYAFAPLSSTTILIGVPLSTLTLQLFGSIQFDTGLGELAIFLSYGWKWNTIVNRSAFMGSWAIIKYGQASPVSTGTMPAAYVPVMRPFIANGLPHQVCLYLNTLVTEESSNSGQSEQVTMYLLGWQPNGQNYVTGPQPVATIAKTIAQGQGFLQTLAYSSGHLCLMSNALLDQSRFACGLNTVGIDTTAISGSQGQSWTVDFFFDTEHLQTLFSSQELGSELHINAAVPFVDDSQIACEDNFFSYPEFAFVSGAGPDVPATLSGQYLYAANYAYPDASGLIHRSAPFFTGAFTPSPQTAEVVTGSADIVSTGVFGSAGTVNPGASFTGTTNLNASALYGPNGQFASPIIVGGTVTASPLYGASSQIIGLYLQMGVDGASVGTYQFTTADMANQASFIARIQAQWPAIVVTVNASGNFVFTDTTRGPNAQIVINNYAPGDASVLLGFPTGGSIGFVGSAPAPSSLGADAPYMGFGFHGQFTSVVGSSATFQDSTAAGFTSTNAPMGAYLCVVGSASGSNWWSSNASAPISSSVMTVTDTPAVTVDDLPTDAWGLAFCPAVRVLTLAYATVGGVGAVVKSSMVINAPSSWAVLQAQIQTKFPGLSATLNASGHLILATSNTGDGTAIIIYNDTANALLGLTPGTSVGSTTTLALNVNGSAGISNPLVIDVNGNGASPDAFLAAVNANWPGTGPTYGLTATAPSPADVLLLTNNMVGTAGTIVVGGGTANAALGLPGTDTPGTAGDGAAIFSIPALTASWRPPGSVWVEISRTVSNGSDFYLIDRMIANSTAQATANPPFFNWPASGGDNTPDSEIDTATLLYTTGGVLPNINPEAGLIQITHNGRVVIVGDTLQEIWPTQAFNPGTASGYSGLLVIPFAEGGNITSLASMDGKLIVFKQSSIWVMFGNNGPSLTAQGSDWTVPQRVPSNVGALAHGATVVTDVGTFFQSSEGIYLLGRDMTVTFIGSKVVDIVTDFPTITSATVVPSTTHVRWTASNGTSTTTIVYDYLLQQWMTHTYPYIPSPVQSSCLTYDVPQQFTMVDSTGLLWQENLPGAAQQWMDQDPGLIWHFVPTIITLAWIRTSQQGYMKAIFAQLRTHLQAAPNISGLQIELAINDNPTIVQTAYYPGDLMTTNAVRGQVLMYIGAKYNQAMAYQFTVSDVAVTAPNSEGGGTHDVGSGQGARFLSLFIDLDKLGPRYPFIPPSGKK